MSLNDKGQINKTNPHQLKYIHLDVYELTLPFFFLGGLLLKKKP